MTSDEIIKIAEKEHISVEELIVRYCPEDFGYDGNNPPMDLWNPCELRNEHCAMCWGRATKIRKDD